MTNCAPLLILFYEQKIQEKNIMDASLLLQGNIHDVLLIVYYSYEFLVFQMHTNFHAFFSK